MTDDNQTAFVGQRKEGVGGGLDHILSDRWEAWSLNEDSSSLCLERREWKPQNLAQTHSDQRTTSGNDFMWLYV